jgi:hypothetical protein
MYQRIRIHHEELYYVHLLEMLNSGQWSRAIHYHLRVCQSIVLVAEELAGVTGWS